MFPGLGLDNFHDEVLRPKLSFSFPDLGRHRSNEQVLLLLSCSRTHISQEDPRPVIVIE